MGLTDLRRRIALLERPARLVRYVEVIPIPAGEVFHGYRCTMICNIDYRPEHLAPGEFFDILGTDPDQCAVLAEAEAANYWTDFPVLVVVLIPITTTPTGTTQ